MSGRSELRDSADCALSTAPDDGSPTTVSIVAVREYESSTSRTSLRLREEDGKSVEESHSVGLSFHLLVES